MFINTIQNLFAKYLQAIFIQFFKIKKYHSFLIIFSIFITFGVSAQSLIYNKKYYNNLNGVHDITSLPDWGPYSKKYAGISHIPVLQQGMRFDLTAMPGFYRNRVMVPNVLFESGYYPWNINADLSKITYRYELEWKDKVYVDVTYTTLDSTSVLVSMDCVNNTSLPQALQLNLGAFINYPTPYPSVEAIYPENVQFINAVEYSNMKYATPHPTDNLVYDGWIRGEERSSDFLLGNGIAKGFGRENGDKISYTFHSKEKKGFITLRYRLKQNTKNAIIVKGITKGVYPLSASEQFELLQIPFQTKSTKNTLEISSKGGGEIEIDGFFIGNETNSKSISIQPLEQKNTPYFQKDLKNGTLLLKYPDVSNYYGIAWDYPNSVVREILDSELDVIFKKYVHEHNYLEFPGDKKGHYLNVFMRPVEVEPMNRKKVFAIACTGNKTNVEKTLKQFSNNQEHFTKREIQPEETFSNYINEAEPFKFSQNMMQTVLQYNIVYPIYTQGQFIRHFTPGKWWNSLYTWDSGFLSLGLSEIDLQKSIECLNAYTTSTGSQSAFIHHGSPVPVQFYAFYDLWNKTQSKELLNYFYPRLRQYYLFMTGMLGSSNINKFNSNLLTTWDYFYNSGGWDDYPPQKAVRDMQLEHTVSPVITTAHMIRCAKILRKVAEETGQTNDFTLYDNDIKKFSKALQNIAWDEKSGYFSYMVHDKNGNPIDFFKHPESGTNYNMGLDGAYPIFSGICTPKQEENLIEKIFSYEHMWTKAGICAVDQQAPYYRIDGYWNGAVWMPHQWFMWKTMLDLGRTELAWKIAKRALNVWKRETDETYFTYEHWFAKNARGAGWHQFGALSSPVLIWFNAYHKPGSVSTGFETWIDKQSFNANHSHYLATLSFDQTTKAHSRSMLICMNPNFDYKVIINEQNVQYIKRNSGLLEVVLPGSNEACKMEIRSLP